VQVTWGRFDRTARVDSTQLLLLLLSLSLFPTRDFLTAAAAAAAAAASDHLAA
jgi:hypothetical protein